MPTIGSYETKRVLITARTYPTPSQKSIEVSCTAGITEDQEWIRLYPIPYRLLKPHEHFRKYQWIEVRAAKSSDHRPESYQIDINHIKVLSEPLSERQNWMLRKQEILPLRAPSLCALKLAQEQSGTSLGFFRPGKIHEFRMVPEKTADWTDDELAKLRREDLFLGKPSAILQKVPFKFYYYFTCQDPDCPGHALSCVDWEINEAYRRWRRKYGGNWEAKFRQRFEHEMLEVNETHFFVGTVKAHPDSWIIIGLFYPRLSARGPEQERQLRLID
jgi:hypothetical protein